MRRWLTIAALITAGEAVFFLPFVVIRVFRPTFLDVFSVSNFEIGLAFSVYGIIAVGAYALGGPIADRFSARGLMTTALVSTAAGGLAMASVPSLTVLMIVYGWWGISTILLFWAAMLRATREWGGEQRLGSAFGLLDGGRGLFAALIGAVSVGLLSALLPAEVETATLAERSEAMRQIILMFTGATFGAAVLVWIALPARPIASGQPGAEHAFSWAGVGRVLALPAVWLQAIIIVSAYVGFKSLDDISLYAYEVLGHDEVKAAGMSAAVLWMRPVAAIGAGLLADRTSTTLMTLLSFTLMLAGSIALASGALSAVPAGVFLIIVGASAAGIYALRGLYFAIMGRARIPMAYTGTAVGIVSTIGYTPDIFLGPLMGYLLDSAPGPPGHYHFFWLVTGFALLGLVCSTLFARVTRPRLA